jgi:hypothetical protein
VPNGATTARARQFPVDDSAHRLTNGFDVTRYLILSGLPQAPRIARERREWRLEPVRQIGGTAARSLDLMLLGVEQRVDFLDQWLDLCRRGRREMMNAASAYFSHALA